MRAYCAMIRYATERVRISNGIFNNRISFSSADPFDLLTDCKVV